MQFLQALQIPTGLHVAKASTSQHDVAGAGEASTAKPVITIEKRPISQMPFRNSVICVNLHTI
ncbi:MAG: hypothetical protein D6724_01005 [Armatimonadetes bacterium]|nr:MAG: hypothetical protein D6724_01005 [Armatimonadota bacterium]